MIRLLKWLITGDAHLHKWKVIHEIPTELQIRNMGDAVLKRARLKHYLQCETCGKIRIQEG